MPFCGKCGSIVNESDNYCMRCGAHTQKVITRAVGYRVPTESEISAIVNRLATDESFRIYYVEKTTCRTNVNSEDMIVGMLRTNSDFRERYVYENVSDEYIKNTKCSELPLDWKKWPNFILVENSFPSEMADCIAAFIKRSRGKNTTDISPIITPISTDKYKSWSVLREATGVLMFEDDIKEDIGNLFLLYALCQEEVQGLLQSRQNNIYEYNKLYPKKYYSPQFLFVDDIDALVQAANDNRIQQVILPYLITYANRLGIYLIFGSKINSNALGNLKSVFIKKSSSEFMHMCKGNFSTDGTAKTEISGYEFEQVCADILRKRKYDKVDVTKKSGDQGIDILAEKDGVKYAIQCKHYTSPVGNNSVQEAFAGKSYYGCHVAIVMTNSTFSDSARQLANKLGVVLWDGSSIHELQQSTE